MQPARWLRSHSRPLTGAGVPYSHLQLIEFDMARAVLDSACENQSLHFVSIKRKSLRTKKKQNVNIISDPSPRNVHKESALACY